MQSKTIILKKQFIESKPLNVTALDTMRDWEQIIKFELLPGGHNDQKKWRLNLCFDRVHKKNTKLSRPLGHLQFNLRKTIDFISSALATAAVMSVKNRELEFGYIENPREEAIIFARKMLSTLIITDVEDKIDCLLHEIKKREKDECEVE